MTTRENMGPLLLRLPAYLAAILPVILMYFITYRASIYLGHWPTYNNPDPKTLPEEFGLLYLATWLSLVLWIPITLLFVWVGNPRTKIHPNKPDMIYAYSVYGFVVLAGVFLVVIDPHGVFDWFMD